MNPTASFQPIGFTMSFTMTHANGCIRILQAEEIDHLVDHLLRLDFQSRRNRFNGLVSENFIASYADRCRRGEATIIAYIENGAVRAAAEMHPDQKGDLGPEVAFSVENDYRRRGLGSLLFQNIIDEARRSGHASLRITTGADNEAMRSLATKFGATLAFRRGESTGNLEIENCPKVVFAA